MNANPEAVYASRVDPEPGSAGPPTRRPANRYRGHEGIQRSTVTAQRARQEKMQKCRFITALTDETLWAC